MFTVRQLIEGNKETVPAIISLEATVFDALKLMAERNVGAVNVVDDQGKMVGIFTERDYARKIILLGHSSLDTYLKDIMIKDMVTIQPDQDIEMALSLMTKHHIRHLPVIENDKLIGMVSMRDIMEGIIRRKEGTIQSLQDYILGQEYNR